MFITNRYWAWFRQSSRWVPASAARAEVLAVETGNDIAWGPRAPRSDGVDLKNEPEAWRMHLWSRMAAMVAREPHARYRLSSVHPTN